MFLLPLSLSFQVLIFHSFLNLSSAVVVLFSFTFPLPSITLCPAIFPVDLPDAVLSHCCHPLNSLLSFFKPSRISPNLKSTVYCSAIAAGGVEEWDFAWSMYKNATIASEAEKLMHALSCTKQPWLLNRSVALSLCWIMLLIFLSLSLRYCLLYFCTKSGLCRVSMVQV